MQTLVSVGLTSSRAVKPHRVIWWSHVILSCSGSETSTVEIHISSELRDYEDVDADGESLGTSVRH